MILTDVNVVVYAHRREAPDHERYRRWLERLVSSDEAYGISDRVLSGFARIVTHARIFSPPTPLDVALAEVEQLRIRPNAVVLAPGSRHWSIFTDLCRRGRATGNLAADAYHAALAIETGSEWVTSDGDFARFPGLRWRHPFETA